MLSLRVSPILDGLCLPQLLSTRVAKSKSQKLFPHSSVALVPYNLTHSYQETRKMIIGKPCRPRSDATSVASDQSLQCLLTRFSIKNIIKVTR